MDALLNEILASAASTESSLDSLETQLSELDTANGMSLLALKNQELLSYVHNSILVLAGQLDIRHLLEGGASGSSKRKGKQDTTTHDQESVGKVRTESIRNAITSRVSLEKGIKPLESRVSYEIDKALRHYEKEKAKRDSKEAEDESSEDDDQEEEEEEDGDLLAFKPNPMALRSGSKGASTAVSSKASSKPARKPQHSDDDDSEDSDEEVSELYVAPKISSVLPSGESSRATSRMRRNALLEEYLAENSSAPQLESSIGSTIADGGRTVRSERDKRKEREIRDYEESNYTRLTDKIKEKHMGKAKAKGRGRNAPDDDFFGEKWEFGTAAKTGKGASSVQESTKKRKSNGSSVWEKASKRRAR